MDTHAAGWANRLLENPANTPVLELLLSGARVEVLKDCWIAITGACNVRGLTLWRAHQLKAGELLAFGPGDSGVWTYLAVPGGLDWPEVLGSASVYSRAHLGEALRKGTVLKRKEGPEFRLPAGVAGRVAAWEDQRTYLRPPRIRIWPGPQWKNFSLADREKLLTQEWSLSPQSDRVGYRLEGPALRPTPAEIWSEPVLPGSIQVPENGQPIITMPDGPTVGGYPKIGLVDADSLPWVAQARPGQKLRFELVEQR
jgi:biotin-dependent carboxylase-like uncharacterized protein